MTRGSITLVPLTRVIHSLWCSHRSFGGHTSSASTGHDARNVPNNVVGVARLGLFAFTPRPANRPLQPSSWAFSARPSPPFLSRRQGSRELMYNMSQTRQGRKRPKKKRGFVGGIKKKGKRARERHAFPRRRGRSHLKA